MNRRLLLLPLFAILALALGRTLTVACAAWPRRQGRSDFSDSPVRKEPHPRPLPYEERGAVPVPLAGLTGSILSTGDTDRKAGAAFNLSTRVQLAQAGRVLMKPLPDFPPVSGRRGPRPHFGPRPAPPDGLSVVARRGRRLVYLKGYMAGVPVHVVRADLHDPDVKVGIVMARAGIGQSEGFGSMLSRTQPAAAITGTFFGLRNGLPTGDIVVNGRAIYQGFVGTALAITDGNVVSFIPCGYKEEQNWSMFDTVVRGGPRLVLGGEIAVNPGEEGFRTLAGNVCRARSAVGITRGRRLLLVAVKEGVTLPRLAQVMRALGAYHAVALDGGTSTALSFGGRVIARPGRSLTNLLVIYADRDRYERARKHFYYPRQRRVLPSGSPELPDAPPTEARQSAPAPETIPAASNGTPAPDAQRQGSTGTPAPTSTLPAADAPRPPGEEKPPPVPAETRGNRPAPAPPEGDHERRAPG